MSTQTPRKKKKLNKYVCLIRLCQESSHVQILPFLFFKKASTKSEIQPITVDRSDQLRSKQVKTAKIHLDIHIGKKPKRSEVSELYDKLHPVALRLQLPVVLFVSPVRVFARHVVGGSFLPVY